MKMLTKNPGSRLVTCPLYEVGRWNGYESISQGCWLIHIHIILSALGCLPYIASIPDKFTWTDFGDQLASMMTSRTWRNSPMAAVLIVRVQLSCQNIVENLEGIVTLDKLPFSSRIQGSAPTWHCFLLLPQSLSLSLRQAKIEAKYKECLSDARSKFVLGTSCWHEDSEYIAARCFGCSITSIQCNLWLRYSWRSGRDFSALGAAHAVPQQ